MTALVLDAGAFIAVDRGDRAMAARLRVAAENGLDLRTTGTVVAQVWRGSGGRQAGLAHLLKAVDVIPIDETLGKQSGVLLGRARMSDAVDASIVSVAQAGDCIVTSDHGDIGALVKASGRPIVVVHCS